MKLRQLLQDITILDMKADLEALATCTCIALLEGWEQSEGAQCEKREALKLGLEIMQFKELKKTK